MTRRRSTPGWRWCGTTNGCCRATSSVRGTGPGGPSRSARRASRPPPPLAGWPRPAASSWRARSAQGLGLLNEAAVAAVSGELDPLSTGIVYCELVCALQALAQYDLAEEWTEAMERWRHGQPVGSVHGRCRVHRAEILRLRGSCVEAEKEALAGLRGAAPLPAPGVRVAVDRARPHPAAPGRHPGRGGGVPRGARGRVGPAARPRPGAAGPGRRRAGCRSPSATRSTHPLNVPSKELPPNTELRRAPLLEAQVEIEVAAGDLDLARAAADELARIAALFESKALAASAALARGRVGLAEGDTAGARRDFERPRTSGTRSARPTRRRSLAWGWRTRTAPRGTRSARSWSSRPPGRASSGSEPWTRRPKPPGAVRRCGTETSTRAARAAAAGASRDRPRASPR